MTDVPGATAAPSRPHTDESLADVVGALVGSAVTASRDGDGALCLDVSPDVWEAAALALRDDVGLDFIDWLSAVDQPDADPPGLDVVVHVVDSRSGGLRPAGTSGATGPTGPTGPRMRRVLLRTRVTNAAGRLASLTAVWPGVAWHERETFEMFGLAFDGYDDGSGYPLRSLLLPEGFEGHPLRKSFVLAARVSKAWPGAKEPGESEGSAPSRRKTMPPGVPDAAVWPREPRPDEEFGAPDPAPGVEGDAP